MAVTAELVTISTSTLPIDGAFYRGAVDGPLAGQACLLMHGNAGNFYRGPSRFLAPALVALGLDVLAANRRGHDVMATVGRDAEGAAFQTIDEALEDGEVMAAHLRERGHQQLTAIGHSNGGFLAAALAGRHPECRALVMLSAHAGGPDCVARDCAAGLLAQDRLGEFVALARERVAEGRGDEPILFPAWWFVATANSFLDRLERTFPLLDSVAEVTCPLLVLRGSLEHEDSYPTASVAATAKGPATVEIVEGSNHHYTGHEDDVVALVTGWLLQTLRE